MDYEIKKVPEDFFVKEIINIKTSERGRFSYYWLRKINYSTIEAVDFISKKLRVPLKSINFAGTKDKRAVTEQLISIKNGKKKNYDFGKIKLEFFGYGDEPVNLGAHKENYFEIILRGIKKVPLKRNWMVNYFDEQRFSEKNVEVGRAIIKRDFRKAVELLGVTSEKNDFVGALRKINRKMLRMYVHAYQSYLWNKSVSDLFASRHKIKCSIGEFSVPEKMPKKFSFPIIGFGTADQRVKKIFDEEKITPRDFIIKQIPEISSEGAERDVIIELNDLKIDNLEDKKIKLSFTLPKGSYATMFIKHLFL